jgi:hypothetical protein
MQTYSSCNFIHFFSWRLCPHLVRDFLFLLGQMFSCNQSFEFRVSSELFSIHLLHSFPLTAFFSLLNFWKQLHAKLHFLDSNSRCFLNPKPFLHVVQISENLHRSCSSLFKLYLNQSFESWDSWASIYITVSQYGILLTSELLELESASCKP